jgi:hypothetical protein
MYPKVLIIQELPKSKLGNPSGYVDCCVILGYEYQVCYQTELLPQVLETFNPDIVFWILQDYTKHVLDDIRKMRLHKKNLKIVLVYDFEMRLVGKDPADGHIRPFLIFPKEFEKVITEQLFTNWHDGG